MTITSRRDDNSKYDMDHFENFWHDITDQTSHVEGGWEDVRMWEDRVIFELRESGPMECCIDGITTFEDYRRQGYGTMAMQWLCSIADKHSICLVGIIDPHGYNVPNTKQLKRFYRSFGFRCGHDLSLTRKPMRSNGNTHGNRENLHSQ